EHAADSGGGGDLQPQRGADGVEEKHRGIGAKSDEGAAAEVDVAGIPAKDVPARRDHHVLQHDEADVEHESVGHDSWQQGRDREHGERAGDEAPSAHRAIPKMPLGRRASVPSSAAKATPGAHVAPMNVTTRLSTSPITMAATIVPGTLPMPAR